MSMKVWYGLRQIIRMRTKGTLTRRGFCVDAVPEPGAANLLELTLKNAHKSAAHEKKAIRLMLSSPLWVIGQPQYSDQVIRESDVITSKPISQVSIFSFEYQDEMLTPVFSSRNTMEQFVDGSPTKLSAFTFPGRELFEMLADTYDAEKHGDRSFVVLNVASSTLSLKFPRRSLTDVLRAFPALSKKKE